MPAESKHHTEVNGSGFMLVKSAGTQKKIWIIELQAAAADSCPSHVLLVWAHALSLTSVGALSDGSYEGDMHSSPAICPRGCTSSHNPQKNSYLPLNTTQGACLRGGTLSFWSQQLRKGKSGAAPPTSSKPGCWKLSGQRGLSNPHATRRHFFYLFALLRAAGIPQLQQEVPGTTTL